MPIVVPRSDGEPLLAIQPVRLLSNGQKHASLVFWHEPEIVSPTHEGDTADYPDALAQLAPRTNFSVELDLLVDPDAVARTAGYKYWLEAGHSSRKALDALATELDRWELDLARRSSELDLRAELLRLTALRRCIGAIRESFAPLLRLVPSVTSAPSRWEGGTPTDTSQTLRAISRTLTSSDSHADALEQRGQAAVALLGQVTSAMQLEAASVERQQQRHFQLVVAVLASIAVLPGTIAAGFEATGTESSDVELLSLMAGSAALTLLALWLFRRRGHDEPP